MPDRPLKTEVQIDPAIQAVEVKITARVEDEDLVLGLLKDRDAEPEERTVYFFDTPELALFDVGLVLRARKVKGDADDTTVKIRPVDPARIPIDWMKTAGFEVEMDRVGQADHLGQAHGRTGCRRDRRGRGRRATAPKALLAGPGAARRRVRP